MNPRSFRIVSRFCLVLFLGFTLPVSTVQAGMVGTAQVAASDVAAQRADLERWLARDEVREALVRHGVDPEQAKLRVAALSDEEVQSLHGRIEQLPAGGDVLGVVVLIFLVLLVTDILGFTKVYPFTRPIR